MTFRADAAHVEMRGWRDGQGRACGIEFVFHASCVNGREAVYKIIRQIPC